MTTPNRRSTDRVRPQVRRHRGVPDLNYDHGGYFKVVASLVLIHLGLGLDSLRDAPRHTPIFKVLNNGIGNNLWALAVLHIVIALLIIAGLYWRGHFALLRIGCGASLILFNVLAVAFAAAAYTQDLSYYSAIASVTLSLSSLAAIKEPPVQSAVRA